MKGLLLMVTEGFTEVYAYVVPVDDRLDAWTTISAGVVFVMWPRGGMTPTWLCRSRCDFCFGFDRRLRATV